MVERRRPGSSSPISLTPKVEEIQTPTAAEPAPAPTPPAASEPAPEAVSDKPAPAAKRARTGQSSARRASALAAVPSLPADDDNTTVPKTIQIRTSLALRAQTAVLRTAPEAGGYRSFAALVNGAIEHELERLAAEFNAGEPFEPNRGGFRTGRPFGS